MRRPSLASRLACLARRALGVAGAVWAASASLAQASPLGPGEPDLDWHVEGALRVSFEDYAVNGDRAESPFRFLDEQSYGQLDLNVTRELTPYRRIELHLLGLLNDSEYRSRDRGAVVERMGAMLEDGRTRLPYRAELGDLYAYFSPRTMQRPIKGFQLEVQAPLGREDRLTSLQVLAGSLQQSWRDFELDDDFATGFSWLLADPRLGRFGVNYLHHRYERDARNPVVSQDLVSLAAHLPLELGGERVLVDGEVAHLSQEAVAGDGLDDAGVFAQVASGGRHAINWRLRYENYGDGYRPAGSPVVADRRNGEAHIGWRLGSGSRLAGRFVRFRDLTRSGNPLDTSRLGVTLSGPILEGSVRGLTTYTDLFVEDVSRRDGSVDVRASSLDSQLFKTFGRVWTPRLRLFVQDSDDRTPLNLGRTVTEVTIATGRALAALGVSGTIEPGILYRQVRGGIAPSDDWQPALTLNFARGAHSVAQTVSLLDQARRGTGGRDVNTLSYRSLYRFDAGRHALTVALEDFDRDADPLAGTRSRRFAFGYAYRFDYYQRPGGTAASGTSPASPALTTKGPLALAELVPGSDMAAVLDRIRRAGLGEPRELGNLLTWETSVVDEIFQRQRLVLIQQDGKLVRSALIIEPEETADPRGFLAELERIRRVFIDRQGRPSANFDDGDFTPDVAQAVAGGRVFRVLEWAIGGSRLRLGIPRRLDGAIRIELQHAKDLGDIREPSWSIDDERR